MEISDNHLALYPEAIFRDIEVQVIAAAFSEAIEQRQKLGNSVSGAEEFVANWSGPIQRLVLNNVEVLTDTLGNFVYETENKVDEALDAHEFRDVRIQNAARRYKLGQHAGQILGQVREYARSIEEAEE